VKIYALLPAALLTIAHAQTPAPKPASTSTQHAAPQPPATTPPPKPASKPPASVVLDPNRVVATVGTQKLTAAEFDAIVDGMDAKSREEIRGPAKRQFMDTLALIMVLAQRATVMHIDQDQTVKAQIGYNQERLLANAARQAMVEKATVTNEELHKYYDENKNDFKQITARHILVRFKGSPVPVREGQDNMTEEEALAHAQDLVKRIKAGTDFATIAKAESADMVSAARGGEMGVPFRRGRVIAAFDEAAFSLGPGEVSDPVKTEFGYHIIRVDTAEILPFDGVRAEIEAKLKPEVAKKQMDEMRSRVVVTLDDRYFDPPKPMLK
jgi:peptidyl-prolyl cis-trans isomerase C